MNNIVQEWEEKKRKVGQNKDKNLEMIFLDVTRPVCRLNMKLQTVSGKTYYANVTKSAFRVKLLPEVWSLIMFLEN